MARLERADMKALWQQSWAKLEIAHAQRAMVKPEVREAMLGFEWNTALLAKSLVTQQLATD